MFLTLNWLGFFLTFPSCLDQDLSMSSRSDYEGMTVKTLQSELRSRGLPTAGKKQELIDRLVHADEDAKASSSIDTQPSNQEEMADDDQGTSAIPTEPSSTEGSDQLTKPEDRKVDDETNQPVGGEVKSPVVGSKRKGVDEETDDAEPSAKRTKGDQSSDEPIVDASTPSTSDNVASSIVVSPSATSTTLVKSPPPVSSSHAVTSSSLNALISSAPSPQPSPSSSSTLSTSSTSASPSSSSASSASSASSTSSSSASSSSSLPTSPPTAPLSSSSGQSTVVRVKGFTRPMRPHDLSALESLVRGFGHVSRYYMHPLRIYLLAQFDSPTAAEVCIKVGFYFPIFSLWLCLCVF